MNLQIIKRKVVTPPRFELELAVPKTAVLPLHHRVLNCLYYNANIQKVKYKNKKISVFLPAYSVWHQRKKICDKQQGIVDIAVSTGKWWILRGLNPRPSDYESPALTAELRIHCSILLQIKLR